MIIVEMRRLLQVLALAVVTLLPVATLALFGPAAFWPAPWSHWMAPFVFLGELALFVGLVSSQRQVRSLVPSLVVASILVGLRMTAALVGALVVVMSRGGEAGGFSDLFADFWMGAPLTVALQVAVLALALPAALHAWAPGFLNRQSLESLGAWAAAFTALRRGPVPMASSPWPVEGQQPGGARGERAPAAGHHLAYGKGQLGASGEGDLWGGSGPRPFICSYDELARLCDKAVGLEGFLLTDDAGLLIWSHIPWNVDVEDLAGALCRWRLAAEPLVADAPEPLWRRRPGTDLLAPRTAALHTGSQWISSVSLPRGVTFHLFFTDTLATPQVAQTSQRLAEAARALFAFRYGAGASREEAPAAPLQAMI